MTDAEGMAVFRDWILHGGTWPSDEFKAWLLPHFSRIFSNSKIITDFKSNGYLPDRSILEVKEFRERTAQARRQYVYDCLRAGYYLGLNPEIKL